MSVYPAQQQVIYQANPNTVQALKSIRDQLHTVTRPYFNQRVRVQMLDGQTYDGIIVNVEGSLLYLSVAQPPYQRQLFNQLYQQYQYNNVILPLVLFELLVITLMIT